MNRFAAQSFRGHRRGAALTEFALVIPVLITILMFSMYLAELARVRLKIQEVARYVAWEMTSYNLADYANNDHATAFSTAQQAAVEEARLRYQDLDSVEPNGNLSFFATISNLNIQIADEDADFLDESVPVAGPIAGVGNSVMGALFGAWGFNPQGRVKVDISANVGSVILSQNMLERNRGGFFTVDQWGGKDLSSLPVQQSYSMIANGWSLPDGGEATADDDATGKHTTGSTSGLYTQVNRMTFMGALNFIQNTPGLSQAMQVISWIAPFSLFGTYVVSHAYTEEDTARDCNNIGGSAQQSGSRNLNSDVGVDVETLRCFDTTPFRDRHSWQNSLYVKAFLARGNNFMGCKQAMADDPTTDNSTLNRRYRDEKNRQKIACNP